MPTGATGLDVKKRKKNSSHACFRPDEEEEALHYGRGAKRGRERRRNISARAYLYTGVTGREFRGKEKTNSRRWVITLVSHLKVQVESVLHLR